jgi:hypothetical protein
MSSSFISKKQDDDIEAVDDEFTHYCSQPTAKVLDAPEWWLQPAQQQLSRHLSKFALEILSTAAMSAEPERLFSATKLIITDRRNKLTIRIIETLASLKSWYKLKDFKLDERNIGRAESTRVQRVESFLYGITWISLNCI